MSELDDESRPLVLAVVGGLVALVVGGVIGLAVTHRGAAPRAPAVAAAVGSAAVRIDFAAGSAQLPASARQRLVDVADAARGETAAQVVVAAGGDTGDAALTRTRIDAVRHALEANGVAPGRIALEPAAAGAAAESVDVRLR